MDENLTDQQQAEKIRDFLRDNGWYLLGGLVLGLGALFGWRQWTSYNTGHAEAASGIYAELVTAVRAERTARAEELADQLVSEYGDTPYVDLARLTLAKLKPSADCASRPHITISGSSPHLTMKPTSMMNVTPPMVDR